MDFFDASEAFESGFFGVEEAGTEKTNSGIFGGVDGDAAVELVAAIDTVTLSTSVVNGENLGAETMAEFFDHLK